LVLVVFVGWYVRRRRLASEAWGELAEEEGLEYRRGRWFGSYRLAGNYRGVDFEVETERRWFSWSVGNSKIHTVFEAELPEAVPEELVMYESDFGTNMRTSLGGEDVEVGREALDEAFVIETGRPGRVRELFESEGVTEALVRLERRVGDTRIEGGQLEFQVPSLPYRADTLESYLDGIADFCWYVAEHRSAE
jgi:hypothetical protein